jgi:RNA-dependent RNA polymerase
MLKYKGGPTMMEINAISAPPRAGSLNVQYILVLLTLGVPLEVRI